MKQVGWRIALITTVPPVAAALVPTLRELGHDPVAIIGARRRQPSPPGREPMGDETAPAGLDVLLAHDKWSVEPLLRASRPDLALCWGFPWRIPQAALDVPPLGSVNCHPALLPRHRGPIPLAWAFRDGDAQFGVTWHRMDSELDTGPILAQAPVPNLDDDFSIEVVGPRMGAMALSLLPRVLARIAAGDPGDEQSTEGVTWAGHFGEDYASVDWSQPARRIHDQVRAWAFTFALSPVVAPVADLNGARVRLIRTSLTEPGEGAKVIETGDGPLWIVEAESLD
jgi:methionyl-tRNA formyltransferase